MGSSEICFMEATQLAQRIRAKELSAREVMEAHLAQIESVNPKVNAIVTQVQPEQALSRALALDEALARGDETARLRHEAPLARAIPISSSPLKMGSMSYTSAACMPEMTGSFAMKKSPSRMPTSSS